MLMCIKEILMYHAAHKTCHLFPPNSPNLNFSNQEYQQYCSPWYQLLSWVSSPVKRHN